MAQVTLAGGCLCGGTRYHLHRRPESINDCHCVDCRRASGAPFVTWGAVPRDEVELMAGAVRDVPHAGRIRTFAQCCGTQLFFKDDRDPGSWDVTIASLDDPTPFSPEFVIWTEDRLPWVKLDPTRPTYAQSRRDGPPLPIA